MKNLETIDKLIVCQKKEWGEIVSGFETKNKYVVKDDSGQQLYFAGEVGGSALLRIFLKALRPFKMLINNRDGHTILRLERPFRFYFHKLDVFDAQGNLLGTIEKRFSILRRIYSVLNNSKQEIFQLFGPVLHPWTFIINKNGREIGKITKRWTGLLKEGFTDADNFGIIFPVDSNKEEKCLLLGAVFLIDFVHFENKGNR